MDEVMSDPVVEEYLHRLEAAARILPDDRRRELVAEIAAHIAESGFTGASTGEAGVRTLLDRLGEPEEIVAAAQDDDDVVMPPGVAGVDGWELRRPGIGLEIGAVLLMTAGSIVPIVAWVVGVVLLWSSPRWRTGEKLLATLVVPGGPLLAVSAGVFLSSSSETCTSSGTAAGSGPGSAEHCTTSGWSLASWIGLPVLAVWLIAPIVIGLVLVLRARNRAAAEPPMPVWRRPVGPARWGRLEFAAVVLLTAGAFVLPGVGPIVGLVCAWASTAWTTREKRIATAIAAVPIVVGLVFFALLFSIAV